ncbi:LlaJI family restriction endonuclease [Shewanella xiamenensis]|uniref:LlaJI family restriction endonuclease n=1 Tax=Shewanella xiamenensis TaxID=332186 RepID=UPI000C12B17C|nr:LlaJI family restriction endonuclease [Shewanella xiamenensis]PHY60435.1 LlaJI family restriction endonuclease [Shewanella xiamenensis]
MINVLFLTDRIALTDPRLEPELKAVLTDSGLITSDMVKLHFCGVISYGKKLAVFLPRNTPKEKWNIYSSALLFKAIYRYYLTKDSGIKSEDIGDDVIGGSTLNLYSQLLQDYQDYGLYIRRTKEKTMNNGRVNWSRTIARSTLLPSDNGPVYLDLCTSRSRNDANNEITLIHASILKQVIAKVGLLWLEVENNFDETLAQTPKTLINKQSQIAYLEKELRLIYSERDIALIKNLLRFLKETNDPNQNDMVIGTRFFHNMWESLLDECLPHTESINSKLPVPVYQTLEDRFVPVAKNNQRLDTFLKSPDGHHYAVIDAKYYDAQSPNSAPGWSDLVKQFFYVNAVKEVVGSGVKVTNHFVFPGIEPKLKAAFVAHRTQTVTSIDDGLSGYPPIYCHYLCPIVLLEKYVNGLSLDQLALSVLSH